MMQMAQATINLQRGEFCLKNICVPLKHSIEGDLRFREGKAKNILKGDKVDIRLLSREDLQEYLKRD